MDTDSISWINTPAVKSDDLFAGAFAKRVHVRDGLFRENRIVTMDDQDRAHENFRLLRARIFRIMRQKGMNIIQVTGIGVGVGVSFVAMNLAVGIAVETGRNTLLADLNFQRPSIARMLGLKADYPGLRSHFVENVPWEELLISPGIETLAVLPAGGTLRNSTEILGAPAMERLVLDWRQRCPGCCVILDTPGLGVSPDSMIVSEYADGVILVARAGRTRRENIKPAMDLVPKEKVLGIVLNDAALRRDDGAC